MPRVLAWSYRNLDASQCKSNRAVGWLLGVKVNEQRWKVELRLASTRTHQEAVWNGLLD